MSVNKRHWFVVEGHHNDREIGSHPQSDKFEFRSISQPGTVKFRVRSSINEPLAMEFIVKGDLYNSFVMGVDGGDTLLPGHTLPFEIRYLGVMPILKGKIILSISGIRPGRDGSRQTVEHPVTFINKAVKSTVHTISATSDSLDENETLWAAATVGGEESSVSVDPSSSHSHSTRATKSRRGRSAQSKRSQYAVRQSRSHYADDRPKSTRSRRAVGKKSVQNQQSGRARKTQTMKKSGRKSRRKVNSVYCE